jgi:outer membrane lipoprotein-sorting protein
MTLKFIYITLCACLAAVGLKAQDTKDADFAERLKTASATTQTIECNFTLTRTMSFMASDVISKGRFSYMSGEGISLDFTEPAGDRITMGRKRFMIVSSGKTSIVKVESNPMLRQLQRMLTACMTGDIAMLEEGAKLKFSEQGTNYIVTLTPSGRAGNTIKLITLTFEKDSMTLAMLRMEEVSGDISQYRFFDKQFNGEIDPARFDVK